jgi:hypothetical protein
MKRRFTKATLALAALAVVSVAISWPSSHRVNDVSSVTSAFVGQDPGVGRVAGLVITNGEPNSIMVDEVGVQVLSDSGWQTISKGQMEVSAVLEPGAKQLDFSRDLQTGTHRRITVPWPDERPWRVSIHYLRQHDGLSGLRSKASMMWKFRRGPLAQLRNILLGAVWDEPQIALSLEFMR